MLKSPTLFTSTRGQLIQPATERLVRDAPMLSNMDPPEHPKYRKLASPALTPQKIGALRSGLGVFMAELWEEVARKSEFDFATDVAFRMLQQGSTWVEGRQVHTAGGRSSCTLPSSEWERTCV